MNDEKITVRLTTDEIVVLKMALSERITNLEEMVSISQVNPQFWRDRLATARSANAAMYAALTQPA